MIVSPHQPRCQDIMANVLGVCGGGEGGGGIRIMYVAPGLSFVSLFHLLLLTACVLLIDRLVASLFLLLSLCLSFALLCLLRTVWRPMCVFV